MTDNQSYAPPQAGDVGRSWSVHLRATLLLGLPLVGSQLAQNLIWLTDTVMLGWLGAEELAASVLGTGLFFICFVVGSGVSNAVMSLVAVGEGRGDDRSVRRTTRMGLWAAIAYGVLIMIPLIFAEAILIALGQEPELAAMAADYTHVSMFGIAPALVAMTMRSFLSAVAHASVLLWVTLFGVTLNAVLVWTLIFGNFGAPALGLTGAAIGSVTTNCIMALALLVYAARKTGLRRYQLFVRFSTPDWQALGALLRLGIPIGLTVLAEVGMFNGAAVLMGWQGIIPLAAHGIVLQIASLAFMMPFGMSQAATVLVGRAAGRGDVMAVEQAAKVALAVSCSLGLATALLFWIVPAYLIAIFLDEADPDAARIIAYGVPLLGIAAAFQIFDAIQVTSAALLRGIRDAKIPMWLAILSYWGVGLPLAYALSVRTSYGGFGVWIGLAIGLALAAALLSWRFFHRRAFWVQD